MTTTTTTTTALPAEQLGPAERLLDLVLSSSAHLWHNRPGLDVGGTWHPARGDKKPRGGHPVKPGMFEPAAAELYRRLLDIYYLNAKLMAHFASYALVETDWRDLKVACAALMLVQGSAGVAVHDDDGSVAFHDDDYRRVGEAMVLHYQKKSVRMLTPKAVLRVAELLESPAIVELNRKAGIGDPASKRAPMGRWTKAATRWLAVREANPAMLEGLVRAGYKETIKALARKVGYKPQSEQFFAVLGWKQKQATDGRRALGLDGLVLRKSDRFDGLAEAEICETIVSRRLAYKEVVGRLPADVGLTPAIMVALLPSLSDRDLRQLTPTLEELGLLAVPEIRDRWEAAIRQATDQRALNIAKNVRSEELKSKLSEAADHAVKHAVAQATTEADVRVMFLVDKSGSMEGAIEQSKEVLSKILSGFPLERLHVAAFDTMGTVLRPKAASRAAVQHMLGSIKAAGGTMHGAAVQALHREGLRVTGDTKLIVIVVGDEAGERGENLAQTFRTLGYRVDAIALLLSGRHRGSSVRDCAKALGAPFSEVTVAQFDDPYHVPRVLRALLEAPVMKAAVPTSALVDKIMATPLLQPPV